MDKVPWIADDSPAICIETKYAHGAFTASEVFRSDILADGHNRSHQFEKGQSANITQGNAA